MIHLSIRVFCIHNVNIVRMFSTCIMCNNYSQPGFVTHVRYYISYILVNVHLHQYVWLFMGMNRYECMPYLCTYIVSTLQITFFITCLDYHARVASPCVKRKQQIQIICRTVNYAYLLYC